MMLWFLQPIPPGLVGGPPGGTTGKRLVCGGTRTRPPAHMQQVYTVFISSQQVVRACAHTTLTLYCVLRSGTQAIRSCARTVLCDKW
jgi:hypothetical protein